MFIDEEEAVFLEKQSFVKNFFSLHSIHKSFIPTKNSLGVFPRESELVEKVFFAREAGI